MGDTSLERRVDFYEFKAIQQDITDMKSLMSRMVEAMGRITIIEERQHASATAVSDALRRIEDVTNRQHQHDVENAVNTAIVARVGNLESSVREFHVEGERNKARFEAVVWMVRGLWALVAAGGVVWAAKLITVAGA